MNKDPLDLLKKHKASIGYWPESYPERWWAEAKGMVCYGRGPKEAVKRLMKVLGEG